MKQRIKSKSLKYSVPTDAKEVAWMAFVVWRDPKDGHGHVTVPWQVRADVPPVAARFVPGDEKSPFAKTLNALIRSIPSKKAKEGRAE